MYPQWPLLIPSHPNHQAIQFPELQRLGPTMSPPSPLGTSLLYKEPHLVVWLYNSDLTLVGIQVPMLTLPYRPTSQRSLEVGVVKLRDPTPQLVCSVWEGQLVEVQ